MRAHLIALAAGVVALTFVLSGAAQPLPVRAATTVVLYGTTGAGNNLSSLYRIDAATGAGTLVGPTGYRGISAIDFHPQTGELYGIGRRPSDDAPVLLKLNPATGAATEIGPTLSFPASRFADMSFRHSNSVLYSWSFPPERLATINLATGAANVFGAIAPVGPGDATTFDFKDTLYHTTSADFGTVDPATGVYTPTTPVASVPPGPAGRTIAAMKFHPQTNVLYAVAIDTSIDVKLARLDPRTGVVTVIGQTVPGLDSIAFQPAAPTLTKSFATSRLAAGASTTLTFTLSNPNLVTLTAVGFSDQLPAGLAVAAGGATGSCGAGVVSTNEGSGTIALANGTLAPSGSCSFTVTVRAAQGGTFTNTTGNVSAGYSGSGGTATASLDVNVQALSIPQVFQNPGAVAIVNPRPNRPPAGTAAAAAQMPSQPAALPVLRPPSTGEAGLKVE